MSRRFWLTLATASLVLAVTGGVVTSRLTQEPPPQGAARPEMVVLTLGVSGQRARIEYSCPRAPASWCGPAALDPQRLVWTMHTSAPVGSTVRVRATLTGGRVLPSCWIGDSRDSSPPLASDESSGETGDGSVASCSYVVSR